MAKRDACCPKCGAEIGDTFEPADWSVGINAGYYCDGCDIGVAEHEAGEREPMEGDAQISFTSEPAAQIGAPVSQISGRPGNPGFEKFKRIARTWGYD